MNTRKSIASSSPHSMVAHWRSLLGLRLPALCPPCISFAAIPRNKRRRKQEDDLLWSNLLKSLGRSCGLNRAQIGHSHVTQSSLYSSRHHNLISRTWMFLFTLIDNLVVSQDRWPRWNLSALTRPHLATLPQPANSSNPCWRLCSPTNALPPSLNLFGLRHWRYNDGVRNRPTSTASFTTRDACSSLKPKIKGKIEGMRRIVLYLNRRIVPTNNIEKMSPVAVLLSSIV